MSTHDKVIANDTFPNFRSDLNTALAAIASQQAGTSDPPAMLAYERQARTDLGVIRRRNAANAGWIIDGTMAETQVIQRSSNTILSLANHLCTINCTSTFTQTFDACSTLTDGWRVTIRNAGSGIITLDPNSTENINGLTTLTLQPSECVDIVCTGTALIGNLVRAVRTPLVFSTSGQVIAAGATEYMTPAGYSSSTEHAVRVPYSGTLRNLRANASNVPGASQFYQYTLRINGVDSSTVATTSGSGSSGSEDLTSVAGITAGQYVTVKLLVSGGANAAAHWATAELEYTTG